MSSSSTILLCLFLMLITTSLQRTEGTFEPSSTNGDGCDGSCKTKCCICSVVRTRPVCVTCCPGDDEKQPGGLPFSPKAAPSGLDA